MKDLDIYQDQKEVIIDNLSTFVAWKKSLYEIRLQSDPVKYSFILPGFSSDENLMISNSVNDYHDDCGCKTGSVFLMLALTLTVTGYFIFGGKLSFITYHKVFWFVGILFFAALTGKGIGLLLARWKLIKLSRYLQQRLLSCRENNIVQS